MLNSLKTQLNLFLLAVSFFTRLPVPDSVQYSAANLNHASRYFSLVGWLLAVILIGIFTLLEPLLPKAVGLFLLMVISIGLTGAFHEDGLADTADGFGGAFDREAKLTIMKDSRLGTYGAIALILALGGKFILLFHSQQLALFLLIAYPMSRALAGSFIFDMCYVTDSQTSKSKPLANSMSITELVILLVIGLMPLILLPVIKALALIAVMVMCRQGLKWLFIRQIGGYTGDCLGAAQQIFELTIYITLLLIMDGDL